MPVIRPTRIHWQLASYNEVREFPFQPRECTVLAALAERRLMLANRVHA